MRKGGNHSWDMTVYYHRCPECGYIFESRQGYSDILGDYLKEETCPRCEKEFQLKKIKRPSFGPLLGK